MLVVMWLVWIPAGGGYFPDAWYPSAAVAAVLLMVTALVTRSSLPTSRAGRVALLAFAGLVALNYLSMLWAGSPGDALQAANELFLYLAFAWTFSILPWTPQAMAVLLGAVSLGIGAFCAIDLARATSASHLTPFFEELRYATPLAYPNATAALAVIGMWPALILSARHEVLGWIRAPLLALAVFLTEFAFLPQSRAALVGLVLTAPLVLAISSNRFRLLTRMAVVGAGLAVTVPRTVSVDDAITAGRHVAPVLQHAANGMFKTSAAALAVGLLLVLAERRLHWNGTSLRSRLRIGRRGQLALVVAGAFVLAGAGVALAPDVGRLTRSVVRSGQTDAATGPTRLLSATPEERFDYVRVAARLFTSSPVVGIGAGNFGRRYDALRHLAKHSRYAHDGVLRILSETGIVGMALFVAVVGTLLGGMIRAARELGGLGRACVVAALSVAAYFLVHDSLDWMDQFPVLAVPALALPLAAIAMRKASVPSGLASRRLAALLGSASSGPKLTRAGVTAVILAVDVAVGVTLGLPYLSIRYVERAQATFRTRTLGAYHDLARAASLNPLSADPLTNEGTIAVDLEDAARARRAFEHANRREDNWYPHLELALLDAQAGQFAQALQELSRAQSLDASDPALTRARTLIVHHQRVDPVGFNPVLLQGDETSIFRPQSIH